MLEETFNCLAFIIGTVGALANLFVNYAFELSDASRRNKCGTIVQTPTLGDSLYKVSLLFNRQHTVKVKIIVYETFFIDIATLHILRNTVS